MRVAYLVSLGALLFSAQTAGAQNTDIKTGPVPDWVNTSSLRAIPDNAMGLAFLRRSDQFIHLNKHGQLSHQSQRIKLLDPRALEVGNIGLVWNPDAGEPTVHKLLIHRNNEVIDVLKNNKFEILRREEQLEQSMLNGFLTAVLRVPDLRVGDELEWAYTVPTHDPTLGNDSYGLIAVGQALMGGRYTFGVSWEKGQKPTVSISDDLEEFKDMKSQSLVVSLDDPEMIRPPKDAPPRYSWQRFIEYSDYSSWKEISSQFHTLFNSASKVPMGSNIKKEAASIKKAHTSEMDRTKAALKLVQQQVRYIYVGLDGGNINPATAEETWERRYGDCKGKSALLMALLNELGVKAEFVLVNNSGIDDGFDTRLPNPSLFDHILVRADIDGETYWLDPTLPDIIEPNLQPLIPYRWVLPLSKNGEMIEPVEQTAYNLPQEMGLVEIDAREGFDEPAKKVQTSVQRGVAGLAEYMQYSAFTANQLKTALSSSLTGGSAWDTITDVSYRYDRPTQASVLTITGTGSVDWDDEGNGAYDLTLPGGGFSPPSKRQRPNETDEDVPFYNARSYSCHVTTVRLPKDTDLHNWGYNSTYDTEIFGRRYYRMMGRNDDRTIRMVRASRVEHPEISSEKAELDNKRIDSFDNSKARIEYVPGKFMVLFSGNKNVPTTYDTDWISPSAPCLPEKPVKESSPISPQEKLRLSAENGDANAQYDYGLSLLWEKGYYSTEALDKALVWFEKAAEQGHKTANLELGQYHADQGTDLKKTVKYLNRADNNKEGAYLLADIYFRNPRVFPDVSEERIMELYRISSENDFSFAQRDLADRYKDGTIVERDEVEALKWIFIANGFYLSENDRFKNNLSDSEIKEARERAEKWITEFR